MIGSDGGTPSVQVGGRWVGDAPAKVNLSLRILARDEGGYHQLETVFQSLDLADSVELELDGESKVSLEVEGVPEGALGPDRSNLAVLAAERFLRAIEDLGRRAHGVRVRLVKRIPHGAGLGGGSSNSAAVLRGLNALSGEPFTPDELLRLGGDLGSDVCFFLTGARRALAWGRGERLLALEPLPSRHVLLVVSATPISTAWAYQVLDRHRAGGEATGRGEVTRHGPALIGMLAGRAHEEWGFGGGWDGVATDAVNDFEEALFPLRPELARVKETLTRAGAKPALLAGSGSAVFGVFAAEEGLTKAAAALRRHGDAAAGGLRLIQTRTAGDS